MPYRSWLFAVALGLATTSLWAQDQPAPEDQPGQEESAPNSDDGTSAEQQQAFDPIPALQGIEAAIRDLVANGDEAEQERNDRDLDAQEEMAKWAFWMFVASAATVLLTFFALLAIIRTLHHTKIAAQQSVIMAEQAKLATRAAQEAVSVTQDIGQAQVRAYITFEDVSAELISVGHDTSELLIYAKVRNGGQSPALFVRASARVAGFTGQQDEMVGPDIAGGSDEPFEIQKICTDQFCWDGVTHVWLCVSVDVSFATVFSRLEKDRHKESRFFLARFHFVPRERQRLNPIGQAEWEEKHSRQDG